MTKSKRLNAWAGSHGHKGRDAAEAAVEMISLSEIL